MGSLLAHSRIPPEEPGRTLLNTGVPQFDHVYMICENAVKVLDECKSKLDFALSSFIRGLGAEKYYEHNPDMREMIKMMLAVLAVECKGHFERIEMQYRQDSLFIEVNLNKLRRPARKMIRTYYAFARELNITPGRLSQLHSLDSLVERIQSFQAHIAEEADELNFNPRDKITSVRAAASNHRKILLLPQMLAAIQAGVNECEQSILDVCEMSKVVPESDKLVTRGVQGASEGLRQPHDVLQKFWPFSKNPEL